MSPIDSSPDDLNSGDSDTPGSDTPDPARVDSKEPNLEEPNLEEPDLEEQDANPSVSPFSDIDPPDIGAMRGDVARGAPATGDSAADGSEMSAKELHLLTMLVEGGMFVVAVTLGYLLAFHDPNQPLSEIGQWPWFSSMFGGFCIAWVLFLVAISMKRWPWRRMRRFITDTEQTIAPIFKNVSIPGLAWISLWAGIGEEFLFRWFLQGGLAAAMTFPGGEWVAVVIASLLFGICHWINRTYAIITTLMGVFFGGLMVITGTVLVPLFAHAFYDFFALVYLTKTNR